MRLDAGTGLPSSMPFLNVGWEMMLVQLPGVSLTDPVRNFLRQASAIGYGMEVIVGWVRSRLPMFPMIPVPQLASKAGRTSLEELRRMPWRRQMLQAGLHLRSVPPIEMLRGLEIAETESLRAAIDGLVGALRASEEWVDFEKCARELHPEDKQILVEAKTEVNSLLSESRVGAYEPGRVARRGEFREETVRGVVERLTGRPRDFADAFSKVDDLIDLCVLELPGQIVSYGLPRRVDDAHEIEIEDGFVTFAELEAAAMSKPGNLVVITDPLLKGDVVQVTKMTFSFGRAGNKNSYGGRRLKDSASVWGLRRSS